MPGDASTLWRSTMRSRLVVGTVILAAWSAAIEARLVYLQVFRHPDLYKQALRQQQYIVNTAANRGEILDRNGRVLAYSVEAESIYGIPTGISEPDRVAAALCGALNDCTPRDRRALSERLSREDRAFAYVKRQVSPDEARRVAALKLDGIGFMKESRRYYPNRSLAAHLLGNVGVDNQGLSGIEAAYDRLIRGRTGTVIVQTDARRQAFSRIERPPTGGATLELTIDQNLQHVVERELRAGVAENRAAGGTALVMDPHTGELLALANWPTFNPNAYQQASEDARRNRAVQHSYEPGSTFKIVTASAALEENVVKPADSIDVSAGQIRFGRRIIFDDHRYGVLSFEDVIVKSSNVGAIKVGSKLGAERLSAYVKRFGFGQRTSPDFPGENPGKVWNPEDLTDSALASVSMGYQVSVTPLQMATALSSVANGGELVEPRVVRAVIGGGRRAPVPRKVVRRTLSPGTAAVLTAVMEQVVERGTGKLARIDGFTVAGKTGTAQKIVNGRYSSSDYNASFVGFVPSRRPAFVIVVVIDSPHGPNSYYGGPVAAPIFQRIAAAGLRLYGVPPSLNAPPPVIVERPRMPLERPLSAPEVVPVVALEGNAVVDFPDLRGLGAREAVRLVAQLGMSARVQGAGVVVDQDPLPGSRIERGGVSTLRLAREVPATAAASAVGGP